MTQTAALLAARLRGAAGQLRHLPRAYRLVFDAAGAWTPAWLAMLLLQGLVAPAIVFLTRPLVDALAEAVRTSAAAGTERVLVLAATIGAILLAAEILRAASDWARVAQAKRVEDHVSGLIHAQSTAIDLAFYEWPEFHDHLHRARDEARHRPVALLENAGALLQSLVTLAGMAAILLPYGLWIALALVASALPALAVLLGFAVRQHELRMRATADERRAAYHDWVMTSSETAAEVRVFGLGEQLRHAYQRLRAGLRKEYLQLARTQAVAEVSAALIAVGAAAACVAWMAWRAIHGEATLGDVALFYAAFTQGQRMMRALLASVGLAYYNVLFLGNLFDYLDLRPAIVDPPSPAAFPVTGADRGLDVTFRNVTFRYPGASAPALAGLNLHVPSGQVCAVVGANGAGKSTLIKLVCRLYDPQEGAVELAGLDVCSLSVDDVRDSVTVLFQDPVRYNDTVAGNIALASGATHAEVVRAARAAHAESLVSGLQRGYETMLGRWFEGGTELSAGQWQRLALARAAVRRSPIILLDEPTSAMDSWTEAGWLDRFRALAAGRTIIIVTHRFTTAMQADVIHVVHEGRVAESGSHAQLLARGGRYADSWREQVKVRDDVVA